LRSLLTSKAKKKQEKTLKDNTLDDQAVLTAAGIQEEDANR
jgi:hypothetical protein